jgi:S-adenosylmethionine-dependent methyltransferase
MSKKGKSYKDKLARDRSFNAISQKFKKNIYGTPKGKIREAVLKRDFSQYIPWLDNATAPKRIIDIGGGQGQLAIYLASLGHHITLVDISEDMLQLAKEHVEQAGLSAQFEFIHAPLQALPELELGTFDFVLCHAVLEWLVDQVEAITVLSKLVNDEGYLSLMYFNKDAHLFANMVYGNFDYVNQGLHVKQKVGLSPNHPVVPEVVDKALKHENFHRLCKTGVRCFHDYLRELEKGKTQFDDLLTLELKYNQQEPYASLGRYTHLLLQANE